MVGNSREDLGTAPAPAHSQEPAPLSVPNAPAADEAAQVQSVSVPSTSDRSSPHPSQKLEQAEAPRTPVHDHKQQHNTTPTMISPGPRRERTIDPGQRPPAAYNHRTPSKPRHLPADAHRHAPTLAIQPQPASLLATDARAASTADDVDELAEEEEEVPETSMTTSSEDARYNEMLKLHDEIEDLESAIDGLSDYYKIVDRLGEGTFSSVYKAIDLQHFTFDNDEWVTRGPLDPFRKGVCHVALKKIYVTSSPHRIFNELSIMEDLRPAEYVSYLITAFRSEDQIVAVMPYSRHRDFRDYYKEMPLGDFKYYFRCLFSALQSVHEAGIMHRDIKPANFLYDPSTGHGTLCDFGLAERFEPTEWRGKCHHTCPTLRHPHGTKEINRAVDSIYFEPGKPLAGRVPTTEGLVSGSHHSGLAASTSADSVGGPSRPGISAMDPPPERVGYLLNDARQPVRANRAGTRGFRAPEVLFKCQDQTVAIDIWSAGVILLTLLIRRFPVFNSNDDVEALLEIAAIFGKTRMETCAMLHNRTFVSNVPTIQHTRTLTDFIFGINPQLAHADSHPNPEQYRQDLLDALDLVKSCLHLNCTSRKTAGELLEHPFLRVDPMEEEVMQQEQDFADYYQGGDEVEGADQGMVEENELGETEDDEYASREQVVQLQSRRGNSAEPTDAPNTPQQLQHQHDATATITPAPQPM